MTIELHLTPEIRAILNEQGNIRNEMQYNVMEVPYEEYVSGPITSKAPITRTMLALLFDQYPQYARLASMPIGIIISTFRTALLNKGGLQGEEAWHQDNIAFPGSKNRNLLITWGPGTEALTSANSELVSAQLELGKQISQKSGNYSDFNKYLPETTVEEQVIPYLKSQSPNGDGNITALIMTGTKVFHRREKIDDESRYGREYRYALNIYYNSADLEEECGALAPSAPPENNYTGGRRRRTRRLRRRRLN